MDGNRQNVEILNEKLDEGLQPRSDSYNELLYRLEQQNRWGLFLILIMEVVSTIRNIYFASH